MSVSVCVYMCVCECVCDYVCVNIISVLGCIEFGVRMQRITHISTGCWHAHSLLNVFIETGRGGKKVDIRAAYQGETDQ